MSQQMLIIARGPGITQASKQHVASVRACVEQLARDPRVKAIYGTAGQSSGICCLVECPSDQDADRMAAMAQVCGLTHVEIIPLVPAEQLRLGLQEAERIAETVSLRTEAPSPVGV